MVAAGSFDHGALPAGGLLEDEAFEFGGFDFATQAAFAGAAASLGEAIRILGDDGIEFIFGLGITYKFPNSCGDLASSLGVLIAINVNVDVLPDNPFFFKELLGVGPVVFE